MTARDICAVSHIEKTKVSRAVSALEEHGLLSRAKSPNDRRAELLSLTDMAREVFADLGQKAIEYDLALRVRIGPEITAHLDELLRGIIADDSADRDEN
jgi:DNA-binding MarR family transcriptional regulator